MLLKDLQHFCFIQSFENDITVFDFTWRFKMFYIYWKYIKWLRFSWISKWVMPPPTLPWSTKFKKNMFKFSSPEMLFDIGFADFKKCHFNHLGSSEHWISGKYHFLIWTYEIHILIDVSSSNEMRSCYTIILFLSLSTERLYRVTQIKFANWNGYNSESMHVWPQVDQAKMCLEVLYFFFFWKIVNK